MVRLEDDRFWDRGYCPNCKDQRAKARRTKTGERALSKARDNGSEVRDGQVFKVVRLPPKRK